MRHNNESTSFAQELRKNMTKEERKLWYEYLHSHPCRFRRQVTCGRYIMDFYCASAKLAVELDGSQRYSEEGQAYDAQRSTFLQSQGIEVLRYSNSDVLQNLRGMCQAIDLTVSHRMKRAEEI